MQYEEYAKVEFEERNNGDFADKIRKELLKRGIAVDDNSDGTKWKIK